MFELCRYKHWGQASPWLAGINPLDQEMPIDGDDGFFPTSGNDMVCLMLSLVMILEI